MRLRCLDRGLIGIDHAFELTDFALLLVHALLRGRFARHQLREAVKILPRSNKLRFILRLFRDCLVERGLKRPGIYHSKRVAFVYLLAFRERDALQRTIELAANGNSVESLYRSEGALVYWYVSGGGRGVCHGNCGRCTPR